MSIIFIVLFGDASGEEIARLTFDEWMCLGP